MRSAVLLHDDPRALNFVEIKPGHSGHLCRRHVGGFDRAEDFPREFLQEDPRTARDVWEAASTASPNTPWAGPSAHDVRSRCRRAEGQRLSYWLLPGQQLPATEADPPGLEPWLQPLRERFPTPTPLDEL